MAQGQQHHVQQMRGDHQPQHLLTDLKTNTTIKLPPTAKLNKESGVWVETDGHRLSQRNKQIDFGKLTLGHRNYCAAVPRQERQMGNENHPVTPRYDQVCSKRSWDSQVQHWRRMLHRWDHGPDPATMRKTDDEIRQYLEQQKREKNERNHFRLEGDGNDSRHVIKQVEANGPLSGCAEVEIGRSCFYDTNPPPPLTIKCMLDDSPTGRYKMIVTPKNIPFQPFRKLIEEKIKKSISKIFYIDEDGDHVVADDDVALKVFLDGAGKSHKPKLQLEIDRSDEPKPTAAGGDATPADQDPAGDALAKDLRKAVDMIASYKGLTEEQRDELERDVKAALVRGAPTPKSVSTNAASPAMPELLQGNSPPPVQPPSMEALLMHTALWRQRVEQDAASPSPESKKLSRMISEILGLECP
eukprot:TRINITY_DN12297_c0_g1_i1.p1 TRINITY_DN12297_c0_g1~~TRINITY_DN12297_c0_g1_i1.p1  ORF type:complete len:481 (+),score=201.01 TRINITY_DN12297_c0_g1_i1:206-1444(+)